MKLNFWKPKSALGQVWIETVIYTLIALVLIGAVLAFAKPKIEQMQDKAVIEQSLEIMDSINSNILNVAQAGPGNKRVLDMGIKKGRIIISGKEDYIGMIIESKHMYSEPDAYVKIGDIGVLTKKQGKNYEVILKNSYSEKNYNILVDESESEEKTISPSSTPYKIIITNLGTDEITGKLKINLEVA